MVAGVVTIARAWACRCAHPVSLSSISCLHRVLRHRPRAAVVADRDIGEHAFRHLLAHEGNVADGPGLDTEGHGGGADPHQAGIAADDVADRSEEHTSELQSLMRNSYAVLRLK